MRTTVEEMDTGQQILAAFYTRSPLVSVKWQCNGVLLNHSIINQITMKVDIYNKMIPLPAYTTSILVSRNQCNRDKYRICLSNEHTRHCEKVYFNRGNYVISTHILWIGKINHESLKKIWCKQISCLHNYLFYILGSWNHLYLEIPRK